MALKVTGKVMLSGTETHIDGCYIRITTTNDAMGNKSANINVFADKAHFKNLSVLAKHRLMYAFDFGVKIEKAATDDIAQAHEHFKKQFEANGYKVEIVDL